MCRDSPYDAGMGNYYLRVIKAAFTHAVGPLDLWTGLITAVLGVVDHLLPEPHLMAAYAWQIPIWTLAAVMAVRLLLAPFWLAQEAAAKTAALEAAVADATPRLKLVEIKERRHQRIEGNTDQEFTLNIQNAGLGALTNCLVKVEQIAPGNPNHTPTALRTYNHAHDGGSSAFNLRGKETKEILLCWTTITPGDTFILAQIAYENGPDRAYVDPDYESEMMIGLYSEAAPTFVRLHLAKDAKGFLQITEAPDVSR